MSYQPVSTDFNVQPWTQTNVITERSTKPAVFVVIPTYNEADNLPNMCAELFKLPIENLSVVVVDDNSPDGTGGIAEGLKPLYPGQVHVLHRPGKQGLGPAYLQGFRYAIDQDADFIIQMDADFSHSPAYLTKFLEQMREYDVVIGSRYTSGGQLDPNWSWMRFWLSYIANSLYVRTILGMHVKDATGGFKCWSRQALSAVMEYPISSSGYIFQVEMGYLAEKLGFKVCEMPIYFADRHSGSSKMSNKVKLEALWRTWWMRWRYRDVQPLPEKA